MKIFSLPVCDNLAVNFTEPENNMEVIRTIKPGHSGSRRFQQHWGNDLVAVALGLKGRIVDGLAEQCSDVELYDE